MRFNCQVEHDFLTDANLLIEFADDDETTIIHGMGDDGANMCYRFTADGSTASLAVSIALMTLATTCIQSDRKTQRPERN